MTGGVSLAVWMGGAAYEMYRLVRCEEDTATSIYDRLLDFTKSRVTVDIVAGTSAGGVNGVLLTAALLAGTKVADFGSLRDTWMDIGDIQQLFRSADDRQATSLLRGDAYFLPQLERAIKELVGASTLEDNEWIEEQTSPLDLVVPATLLNPDLVELKDSYGEKYTEIDHQAFFSFGWGSDSVHKTPEGPVIRKLALAGRTSASFPFAFEPSFVPVGKSRKPEETRTRSLLNFSDVSMRGNVSTRQDRFMVDGGILDNKPIGHALDLIVRRPARNTVKRIVAYLAPSVQRTGADPGDRRSEPPSLNSVVMSSALSIPAYESIADDISRLQSHNESIEDQQERRRIVIKSGLADDAGDSSTVKGRDERTLVDRLLSGQTKIHAAAAARRLVATSDMHQRLSKSQHAELIEALTDERANILKPVIADHRIGGPWKPERIESLRTAVKDVARAGGKPLTDTSDRQVAAAAKEVVADEVSKENWPWGLFAVSYAAEIATSIVRRSMLLGQGVSEGIDFSDQMGELARVKTELHAIRRELAQLKNLDKRFWRVRFKYLSCRLQSDGETTETSVSTESTIKNWCNQAFNKWPDVGDLLAFRRNEPEAFEDWDQAAEIVLGKPADNENILHKYALEMMDSASLQIAALLEYALDPGRQIANEREQSPRHPREEEAAQELMAEIKFFAGENAADNEAEEEEDSRNLTIEVLERLVNMYVVQTTFGVLDLTEHPAELLLVSADVNSPLGGQRGAEDKLAGMQLANFAGFLKRSWRANDWMWGRLDAADRIVRMLVDPERIRQIYGSGKEAWEGFGPIWKEIERVIGERSQDELNQVEGEFDQLDEPGPSPATPQLHKTYELVSRALQVQVAGEELPQVAQAMSESRDERAHSSGPSLRFERAVDRWEKNGKAMSEAEHLLGKLTLGNEEWKNEAGSDHFTQIASQAGMVMSNIATNPNAGLTTVGRVMDKGQSFVSALYLLAQLAVRRSRTTFALAIVTFLAAGLLLTFNYALLPEGVSAPSVLVGTAWPVLVSAAWLVVGAATILLLFYRYGIAALVLLAVGAAFLTFVFLDQSELKRSLAWCCGGPDQATIANIAVAGGVVATGYVALGSRGRGSGAFAIGAAVGAVVGFFVGLQLPWDWKLAGAGLGFMVGGIVGIRQLRGSGRSTSDPITRRMAFLALASIIIAGGIAWLLSLVAGAIDTNGDDTNGALVSLHNTLHAQRISWAFVVVAAIAVLAAILRFATPFSETRLGVWLRRNLHLGM